jgi:hypothetical protein
MLLIATTARAVLAHQRITPCSDAQVQQASRLLHCQDGTCFTALLR